MPTKFKVLVGIGLTLLIVGIGVLGVAYYLVTKSFPETSGSNSLPGLEADVRVYRDDFGVPHILAGSEHDAYFAVGYVHAQDRLWQMELARRAGMGRLAEVLGEPALKADRLFRTLRIWKHSLKLAAAIDEETKEALQAYADGVNSFIQTRKGHFPIEFDMLNIEPEPWRIEHSVVIGRLMAWELNYARWVDVLFGALVERFGARRAREIFPQWPSDAPTIIHPEVRGKKLASLALDMLQDEQAYRVLLGMHGLETGSNAWVVSGSKSVTGKPILANDPHLLLFAPGRWYEMHVSCQTMDVEGTSIAGIPFVVIGHNRHIAWGVTNAMVDDEDFYVEDVDSIQHPTRYRLNQGWEPVTEETDTIIVKNQPPVALSIYSTHRGPIINRIEPSAKLSRYLLSMRWVGHELSNESAAFRLIDKATNWKEFKDALRNFGVPAQNFVYADIEGNIGYYTGGKLPLRKTKGPTLPFPGWTDEYDWKGFVPFEAMPNVYNPPDGFIATANNKIIDDSYPYHISTHWEPSWRIKRITELLNSQEKFSVEDFQRFQLDYVSTQARELVPIILKAYAGRSVVDNDVQTVLTYFRNWRFEMSRDDVTTTLFEAFFLRTIYNTFHDEMGDEVLSLYDTLASVPMTVMTTLLEQDSSEWFDNIHTPQHETKEDIIRLSLEEAIQELKGSLGGEIKEWQWGRVHKVEFTHVFGDVPLLRSIFNIGPFPIGGSHSTINKGDFRLAAPYKNSVGPSTRQIFDLSDLNNTRAVTPPGQSGHAFHKNYQDQVHLWLSGFYRRVPMDRNLIERLNYQLLTLRPQR